MNDWLRGALAVATGLAALAAAGPAAARDKPADGWSDVAEFSYVATAGNSETATLGFKNTLGRKWGRSSFECKAGGIRTQSTTITREVVAPSVVDETRMTELKAENYYLNGRYNRTYTVRSFWFAGAGWERNRFSGVENRYSTVAGVGTTWVDDDRTTFRTDYAVTYTKEDDVVENPDVEESYLGARLSSKYQRRFATNTTYGNDLVLDANADDTSDFRADMTNWLAASINDHLALKVSLQWLYDHQPALVVVPDPDGAGPLTSESVALDTLDTTFTASLVVNF
jgi:putative salt-induced outer membrane protein